MGIFAKKVCDRLDRAMVMGDPFIWHRRRSDPHRNKEKEAAGKPLNEILWKRVDRMALEGSEAADTYGSLAKQLGQSELPRKDYFSQLSEAMGIWLEVLRSAT